MGQERTTERKKDSVGKKNNGSMGERKEEVAERMRERESKSRMTEIEKERETDSRRKWKHGSGKRVDSERESM